MLFEECRYVYEECTEQRAATIYEDCKRNSITTESLNFLLFNFCNDCLFVEVSDNKIFSFFTCNSCFFNFLLMGFRDKRESASGVPRKQKG